MDELLKALDELWDGDCKRVTFKEDPNWTYFDNTDERYHKVDRLCNDLLITGSGHCNWGNIRVLRESGYKVFPGEQDSFGWLIGCIQKKGHIETFTYG